MTDKRKISTEPTKQSVVEQLTPNHQVKGENKKDHHGEVKISSPDENHKRGSKSPKPNKTSSNYEPYQVKKNCKNNQSDSKKPPPEPKRDHKQIQFCLTVTEKSYKLGDTRICKTKTDCKPCETISSPTSRKTFGKKIEQSKPAPNEEYYKAKVSKKSKGNFKQQQSAKANNVVKTAPTKAEKSPAKKVETNKIAQSSGKTVSDVNKQQSKSTRIKTDISPPPKTTPFPSPVVSKSEADVSYDIYLTPAQRRSLNSANQGQTKSEEKTKQDNNSNDNLPWQQKKQYQKPPSGRSYTNKQKQIHAQKKKNENSQRYNHNTDKKKYVQNNKKESAKNNLNNGGTTKEKLIDAVKTDQAKRKLSDAKNNTIKVLGEVLAQVCETNRSFDKKDHKVYLPAKITIREDYESICFETLEKIISAVEKETQKHDSDNSICHPLSSTLLLPSIVNKNVSNTSNEIKLKNLTTDNIDLIKEFVPHHSIQNDISQKTVVTKKMESEKNNASTTNQKEVSSNELVSPQIKPKDSNIENRKVSVSDNLSNKLSNLDKSQKESTNRKNTLTQNQRRDEDLPRTKGLSVMDSPFTRINQFSNFPMSSLVKGQRVLVSQHTMDEFNDNSSDLTQDSEFMETSSTSSSDDDFKIELVQNRQISSTTTTTTRNEYNNIQQIPDRNLDAANHISERDSNGPRQDSVSSPMSNLSVEQIKLIKKIDHRKRVRGLGILECPCSLSLDGERIGFCDVHELICQS